MRTHERLNLFDWGIVVFCLCPRQFVALSFSQRHVNLLLCRHYCVNMPESLPKLLLSVKWNSRDEVSQVPNAGAMSLMHLSTDLTSNPPNPPSSSSDVLSAEGVASDGTRVSSGAVGLQLP